MIEAKKHSGPCPDAHFIAHDEARRLFEEAYDEHLSGNLDIAMNLYQRSLEIYESAPAYTYLGWAISALGDMEKAIGLCKKAIDLDPDYGNPYNDIGAYYLHLGKDDDAIHWLERALVAPKYDCRFYPYFNLGRVYQNKNLIRKAITCFKASLEIKPDFKQASDALEKIENSLN